VPATTEPNADPRVAISLGYEFPLFGQSNLCHGIGGNGYAFLKLFARTRDEKWLARARVRHARIGQVDADAAATASCAIRSGRGDPGFAVYSAMHSRGGGVPDPRCFPCPRTSAMNNRFLLAQVTDMHIKAGGKLSYRVVDTEASLARCIAHLMRLPQGPDAVLFTGDLVDFGLPEEYDNLARLLSPLTMPFFLMPGNHDDPEVMRAKFPAHAYLRQRAGKLDYAIDELALRIVALDSTVPKKPHGGLTAEQLAWLDATLGAAPAKPTVVALHHPPFWTGIGHMDVQLLKDPAPLEAIISRHPQVERVMCGHLHRDIARRFGGTIAATCPSPSHQVALDLADDAASRFVMEPPGFQLHLWREGVGLVSHTAAIGEFAGPYPFYEGGKLID
jgi:hypothetical protein